MKILHNSQQAECREPLGALPLGKPWRLRLLVWDEVPEEGDWLSDVTLRLWRDDVGEQLIPMRAEQGAPGERRFVAELPAEAATGLIWYYFILRTGRDDLLFFGNNADGLGGAGQLWEEDPRAYQVTVYQPEEVPQWYRRAVCYQIFPDRFARGDDWEDCKARAHHIDWLGPHRTVQDDWQARPSYTRDAAGNVLEWPHYGGSLQGLRQKLLYLKSLGVSAIYLNPIFRATSNHKYDTADYRQIDPSFGTEQDFCQLADDAARLGIRLILDGVFSHTGADSRYFNLYGNYPDLGAYQSEESLYHSWYKFNGPDDWAAWWGVKSLPEVDKNNADFREFIFGGKDSVVRHWLGLGAAGWRLDVADELPEDFIRDLRAAAREEKPDALLLGEVWEDASNKVSYGKRRHYLLGGELDATMNYPFRGAALAYLLGQKPAAYLAAALLNIKENYPPEKFAAAYNLIGTHDTVRAANALSGAADGAALSADELALGQARQKLAALLQFAVQGVPAIYYGDEAGMCGWADPDNRAAYPWGQQNADMLAWYRRLAALRAAYPLLVDGEFDTFAAADDVWAGRRFWPKTNENQEKQENAENIDNNYDEEILVLINRADHAVDVKLPVADGFAFARELLAGAEAELAGELACTLPPFGAQLWLLKAEKPQLPAMERAAGVLCHITSLPDAEGGWPAAARRFIDYLAMAKIKLWQVLPINPVGDSLSPYTPMSVFAADERLAEPLLKGCNWADVPIMEYTAFCRQNATWLDDWALFSAISRARAGLDWRRWPRRERDREDVPRLMTQYAEDVEQVRREQFLIWREWAAVRAYAAQRGVKIIGDMPIYPAPDGADVWANRHLFWLDDEGYPTLVAGVPPDYFAEDGQIWGNPVYNWDAARADGFAWWGERCRVGAQRFDWLRVDHFRAFAAGFAIPQGGTAADGYWLPGPGAELFKQLEQRLGRLPLLAEDLGYLDGDVVNLLRLSAYPGMTVYQFAADELDKLDLSGRVLYSGTHDNQTLCGWLAARQADPDATPDVNAVINRLLQTAAPWVIIPLQDMLGLGDEARMNTPGVADGNWRWRADWAELKLPLAAKFARLVKASGR